MERSNSIYRSLFFVFVLGLSLSNCTCKGNDNGKTDDPIVFDNELDSIIIQPEEARTKFVNYGEHRAKIIKIYEDNGRSFGDSMLQNQQYLRGKKQENKGNQQGDKADKQDTQEGFVPVEYTYYEFDKLKKYLKFIEQETKKAGYDISTMRIYFANYSENEKEGKRKRNTVMFVPTIEIDEKESAYYLSDEGPEGKFRPFILTDSFVRTEKPAPMGKIGTEKNTNEANLFPNFNNNPPPVPFYLVQSVIGNEGHRNP